MVVTVKEGVALEGTWVWPKKQHGRFPVVMGMFCSLTVSAHILLAILSYSLG